MRQKNDTMHMYGLFYTVRKPVSIVLWARGIVDVQYLLFCFFFPRARGNGCVLYLLFHLANFKELCKWYEDIHDNRSYVNNLSSCKIKA